MPQALPFGGVKDSGYGRFAGPEGLRACCLVKSVTVDRFPKIMGTVVPAPLQVSALQQLTKRFFGTPLVDEREFHIHEGNMSTCGKLSKPQAMVVFLLFFCTTEDDRDKEHESLRVLKKKMDPHYQKKNV